MTSEPTSIASLPNHFCLKPNIACASIWRPNLTFIQKLEVNQCRNL